MSADPFFCLLVGVRGSGLVLGVGSSMETVSLPSVRDFFLGVGGRVLVRALVVVASSVNEPDPLSSRLLLLEDSPISTGVY